MNCAKCGSHSQGRLCRQCEIEQNHEHLAEDVGSDSLWDSTEDDDDD